MNNRKVNWNQTKARLFRMYMSEIGKQYKYARGADWIIELEYAAITKDIIATERKEVMRNDSTSTKILNTHNVKETNHDTCNPG